MNSLAGGAMEVVACCVCGSLLGDFIGAAIDLAAGGDDDD